MGRGDKVDVRLVDEGISREHAQLVQQGDKVILEDLGSTNGTFCNGTRVQRQALSHGDKILLGSTTILKFSYHDKLDEMFQRQMSESALRDGLTKTFNKRYLSERLESEFTYAARHGDAAGAAVPRHRPLQEDQRRLRTPRRRLRAHRAFEADHRHAPPRGHPGALRRRGVRDHLARHHGQPPARPWPSACASWSRRMRSSYEDKPIRVTISVGVAGTPAPGRAVARRSDRRRRRDDVRGQAVGPKSGMRAQELRRSRPTPARSRRAE